MHKLLGKTQKLTPIEAWGTTVYVRRMSGLARELVTAEAQKDDHKVSIRALVVRHAACDSDGKFLFRPLQQNSWVKFGSGRSPSVWYRAISMVS
jgi:hypothetical protein